MKLEIRNMRKVTEPDFSEKFPFAQKRAKFLKIVLLVFSDLIFFMKLGDHIHSKVTELDL